MLTLTEIENRIFEKLVTDITDVSVVKYPDDYLNYQLTHPKGAVLLKYDGEQDNAPNVAAQFALQTFTITVISKSLRVNTGAYDIIDQVRMSLTNDLYINNQRLYVLNVMPLGAVEGKWYYEMTFLLPVMRLLGE